MEWAIAAGRDDLLEKKINTLIKYFLCSEHFTDDCFNDPPRNSRLKRQHRPEVSFPIPTIFNNNIDKYLPNNNKAVDNKRVKVAHAEESHNDFIHESLTEADLSDSTCAELNNFVHLNDSDSLPQIDAYDAFEDLIIEQSPTSVQLIDREFDCQSDELEIMCGHCRLCATVLPLETMATISGVPGFVEKLQRLLPDLVS